MFLLYCYIKFKYFIPIFLLSILFIYEIFISSLSFCSMYFILILPVCACSCLFVFVCVFVCLCLLYSRVELLSMNLHSCPCIFPLSYLFFEPTSNSRLKPNRALHGYWPKDSPVLPNSTIVDQI